MERVHEHETGATTPPAPGELELVRSFLSLHDHEPGRSDSLAPSLETLEWWFRHIHVLPETTPTAKADLEWAAGLLEDLREKVFENVGRPVDPQAVERLNAAARGAGLEIRFGNGGGTRFETRASRIRGAVGRLLGVAFLAELDGSWRDFKECGSPTCRSIFYDRSKNHSGKWCSMQSCGNRAKVRAFRERRAAKP